MPVRPDCGHGTVRHGTGDHEPRTSTNPRNKGISEAATEFQREPRRGGCGSTRAVLGEGAGGLGQQNVSMSHAQNLSMESDVAAARDAGAAGFGVPDIQSSLDPGQAEGFAKLYSSAWLQAMAVYYGVAVFLHYVVPALTNPHRVQHGDVQPSSETRRDAARALVPVGLSGPMASRAVCMHRPATISPLLAAVPGRLRKRAQRPTRVCDLLCGYLNPKPF